MNKKTKKIKFNGLVIYLDGDEKGSKVRVEKEARTNNKEIEVIVQKEYGEEYIIIENPNKGIEIIRAIVVPFGQDDIDWVFETLYKEKERR